MGAASQSGAEKIPHVLDNPPNGICVELIQARVLPPSAHHALRDVQVTDAGPARDAAIVDLSE
jgi:hypothetical protein